MKDYTKLLSEEGIISLHSLRKYVYCSLNRSLNFYTSAFV